MTETNTTATTPVSQADLEAIEKLYSFRDYEEYEKKNPYAFTVTVWRREQVLEFIKENSFLIPLLLEIPERVKQYFPDPKLYLEVHVDPEIVGDISLIVFIATTLKMKEVMKREHQFDHEWWFDNIERGQNKLEVFTE